MDVKERLEEKKRHPRAALVPLAVTGLRLPLAESPPPLVTLTSVSLLS